ncbi:MAG: glycoside hydrolase [Planctomycetaceae bacterium]|nr:glycoside hydrolase [Planctomycetaceae bacterium]
MKHVPIFLTMCLVFCISVSFGDSPSEPPDKPLGAIVNHIPKYTGIYIGSPSLCILPDGTYLASHEIFSTVRKPTDIDDGKMYFPKLHTIFFRSTDKGEHWEYLSVADNQYFSAMFVHDNVLYTLGTTSENGDIVIKKSTDGGRTWSVSDSNTTGLLFTGKYSEQNAALIHNGRVWRAFNRGWGQVCLISAPVDADLLNADNWTMTNAVERNTRHLDGRVFSWIEGVPVADRDGQLWIAMRINLTSGYNEYAAFLKVGNDGKTLTFDPDTQYVPFEGASTRFTIKYDPDSQRYWSIVNILTDDNRAATAKRGTGWVRNIVALKSSPDLRNWTTHKILLQHPDAITHGWQYIDLQFDGDDLIFLSRTGYDDEAGGADTYHNANYLTFHRVKNFRSIK